MPEPVSLLQKINAKKSLSLEMLKNLLSELSESDDIEKYVIAAINNRLNKTVLEIIQNSNVPWNFITETGKTFGDMAYETGNIELYEMLVDEGVRSEFILKCLGTRFVDETEEYIPTDAKKTASNERYLSSKLLILDDRVVDEDGNAVMMGWEKPLMEIHVDKMEVNNISHVLNVGFGMGIIDKLIQERNPASHTIIEAHPDIYKRMIADGWDKKVPFYFTF